MRSVDTDTCDEPGLPCISSSQQQVCDDRAEARAQQDARVHEQCPRAQRACDCAGANAASPQSVRMRGILTPALRSGGTPCLSSGGLLLLLCLRPPAIVDLRRQVQEALCGLEALIVPCRRSSAYFPHCQHRYAGSAGIGWEPATLGNAGSARWWRAPAHMRGACVHNERRARFYHRKATRNAKMPVHYNEAMQIIRI